MWEVEEGWGWGCGLVVNIGETVNENMLYFRTSLYVTFDIGCIGRSVPVTQCTM